MLKMTLEEIELTKQMGRKVYWKHGYAWVAKYFNSKWWNPFDWYKVKINIDK